MLPAHLKLHRSKDFSSTMRGGSVARSRTLMVHVLVPGLSHTHPTAMSPGTEVNSDVEATGASSDPGLCPRAPRFGFVVSKAVGHAVDRHATARKLRHACMTAAEQGLLPPGTLVVIRAFPAAAAASSAEIHRDLDKCLVKALSRPPKNAAPR